MITLEDKKDIRLKLQQIVQATANLDAKAFTDTGLPASVVACGMAAFLSDINAMANDAIMDARSGIRSKLITLQMCKINTVLAALTKEGHELGADEPRAANYYNLHGITPHVHPATCWF